MRNVSFCILVLLLACAQSFAQPVINEDGDDPYDELSFFNFGLNYLSNNVYLGRKDTSVISYYSPYIGYHFKDGIYAKAMISLSPVNATHLDLTILEAGYGRSFGDHFNGGLNLDRYIYNKNSVSIRANGVGAAGVNGQFSNDYIEPTAGFDLNFNKKSTDYVASLLLDHNFKLANKKMNIIPAVLVNIGTRHYLDEYYVARINKKQKTKLTKVVANAKKFNALDYECSLKTTYMTPRWLFTFIPTYAIPVNPATITLPGNHVITEKLTNSFFAELDICRR
jgi:hypothetical protein